MDKTQFEGLIAQRTAPAPKRPADEKATAIQEPKTPAAPNTSAGQSVTLGGLAKNAALGAILLLDDRTPVYIDGLAEWDPGLLDKRIEARGILQLRKLAPDPAIGPDGAVSHGMHGSSKVLMKASWSHSTDEQPP